MFLKIVNILGVGEEVLRASKGGDGGMGVEKDPHDDVTTPKKGTIQLFGATATAIDRPKSGYPHMFKIILKEK